MDKIHSELYIYQFHLFITSLNLTMNTFTEYTGILNLTLNTFPEHTRYCITYLFNMLSGRIEQLVFFFSS